MQKCCIHEMTGRRTIHGCLQQSCLQLYKHLQAFSIFVTEGRLCRRNGLQTDLFLNWRNNVRALPICQYALQILRLTPPQPKWIALSIQAIGLQLLYALCYYGVYARFAIAKQFFFSAYAEFARAFVFLCAGHLAPY